MATCACRANVNRLDRDPHLRVVAQKALTMDDYKLLISMGSTLASLAGAFAVVRYQVKSILSTLQDVEKRLRAMDTRIDKAEWTDQKVSTLAGILSPSERDKSAREMATLVADTKQALERIKHLETMHNTKHPIVASERKAT